MNSKKIIIILVIAIVTTITISTIGLPTASSPESGNPTVNSNNSITNVSIQETNSDSNNNLRCSNNEELICGSDLTQIGDLCHCQPLSRNRCSVEDLSNFTPASPGIVIDEQRDNEFLTINIQNPENLPWEIWINKANVGERATLFLNKNSEGSLSQLALPNSGNSAIFPKNIFLNATGAIEKNRFKIQYKIGGESCDSKWSEPIFVSVGDNSDSECSHEDLSNFTPVIRNITVNEINEEEYLAIEVENPNNLPWEIWINNAPLNVKSTVFINEHTVKSGRGDLNLISKTNGSRAIFPKSLFRSSSNISKPINGNRRYKVQVRFGQKMAGCKLSNWSNVSFFGIMPEPYECNSRAEAPSSPKISINHRESTRFMRLSWLNPDKLPWQIRFNPIYSDLPRTGSDPSPMPTPIPSFEFNGDGSSNTLTISRGIFIQGFTNYEVQLRLGNIQENQDACESNWSKSKTIRVENQSNHDNTQGYCLMTNSIMVKSSLAECYRHHNYFSYSRFIKKYYDDGEGYKAIIHKNREGGHIFSYNLPAKHYLMYSNSQDQNQTSMYGYQRNEKLVVCAPHWHGEENNPLPNLPAYEDNSFLKNRNGERIMCNNQILDMRTAEALKNELGYYPLPTIINRANLPSNFDKTNLLN